MSLIERLSPCSCGKCDAYTAAAQGAEHLHSETFWRGGMRASTANDLAQLITHGSLFWMGHSHFERWTA